NRLKLLKNDAMNALNEKMSPSAKRITPKMTEASLLLDDRKLNTVDDLKQASIDLHKLGASYVLVKGGELAGPAIDVLYEGETLTTYEAPRILTENTSGA